MKRLIAAIDTPDPAAARAMIHDIAPACGMIKLGLEFFMANGPAGLAVAGDMPVFLDMKLHDIPNTVAGAVRALSRLRIAMLSIHASGGSAMIAAARDAAGEDPARPKILAVTVLTSLDEAGLAATGVRGGTAAQVENLAALALAAGADGLVCSPHEVALLRRR
ncbi:MAG TPA: orotidine 5'-phosphate decarboxylase, partial [Acetobacteraceae bacterium]|nr:orotidine 5'-phosphate decarboxylase [Acetobacteraceae bacterium]